MSAVVVLASMVMIREPHHIVNLHPITYGLNSME